MIPSNMSKIFAKAYSRRRPSFQVQIIDVRLSSKSNHPAKLHPAIPQTIVTKIKESEKKNTIIDAATIQHLERISLVDFANVRGIERLEEAIELADIVTHVDTRGVEPLYSILEEETLYLRPDEAVPPNNRKELMSLSTVTDEDYYVAPQGNVPLSTSKIYDRKD